MVLWVDSKVKVMYNRSSSVEREQKKIKTLIGDQNNGNETSKKN
jgi:hypothetical protein